MMRTELPEQLQSMLRTVQYATIATVCPDGQPWSTPLYVTIDDRLHVYWASWVGNQHSLNIAHDERIFLTMFDTGAPAGQGVGLYMQMRARQLNDAAEIRRVHEAVYATSFGEDDSHDAFMGVCVRRLYKAVPEKVWYNDDGEADGQFIDVRRPVGVYSPPKT